MVPDAVLINQIFSVLPNVPDDNLSIQAASNEDVFFQRMPFQDVNVVRNP